MSSKTVWTLPPFGRYDTEKMKAWAAEQGFDANNIQAGGFHITQERDGTYVARGFEFEVNEDGRRILDETTESFQIHEWSHSVSGLPTGVAR